MPPTEAELAALESRLQALLDPNGTGRSFASPGVSLHRIAEGRIVEDWEYSDDIGQMRQLGFRVEPPEETPA